MKRLFLVLIGIFLASCGKKVDLAEEKVVFEVQNANTITTPFKLNKKLYYPIDEYVLYTTSIDLTPNEKIENQTEEAIVMTVQNTNATDESEDSTIIQINKSKKEIEYETINHDETYYISVNVGNVRKGPNTTYEVITQLKNNAKLQAFEKAIVEGTTWYHVNFGDKQSGWVSSTIVSKNEQVIQTANLIDVPLINQYPELPSGCEVTALAMALNYYGINVSKTTLADQMIYDDVPIKRAPDRTILQWGDPDVGYVGDPYDLGITINPKPLKQLLDQYRPGGIAIHGEDFSVVEKHVKEGKPTLAWITLNYEMPIHRTWKTPEGKEVFAPRPLHVVTITGVDDNYVYFNDSDANKKHVKVPKKKFIQVYNAMGKRALIVN